MNRSLYPLLVLATFVACSPAEAPEAANDTEASRRPGAADVLASDSPMVVPTEVRVPSDDRPVVVFLGTSLTAGLGLERESDTYVSVLAQMADSAGKPFRAVNAGVSGDTSAGGLRRVDWILRTPVDVMVVELGANDGLRGQDPEALAANLTEIIRRTREAYPEVHVVVAGMEAPPNMGDPYTAAFRAVFPEVARAQDAALVPFLLDGVAGVPELNQDDRIHPTPEGHRRVALNVWPVLEGVLDEIGKGGGAAMKGSIFGPGTIVLGGGAVVLLLLIGIGFLLPTDWEANAEGFVPASPEVVLSFLDSPEGWQAWTPWPDSTERTGPARGAGATIAWDNRELGAGTFQVESATPREVTYRVRVQGAVNAVMETRGTVELSPEGEGTRLRWREAGDLGRNPLMGYWAFSMDRAQSAELAKSIDRLAEVIDEAVDGFRADAPGGASPVDSAGPETDDSVRSGSAPSR